MKLDTILIVALCAILLMILIFMDTPSSLRKERIQQHSNALVLTEEEELALTTEAFQFIEGDPEEIKDEKYFMTTYKKNENLNVSEKCEEIKSYKRRCTVRQNNKPHTRPKRHKNYGGGRETRTLLPAST